MATGIEGMDVSAIMRRWPVTIGVFIDLGMHCVGCPVGGFTTPAEAAAEHGLPPERLIAELAAAIAGTRVRAGPARPPRQSAEGDGDR